MELTIKKTVGQPSNNRPGEKDYMIHLSNGQAYLAMKSSSSKYTCNGVNGSLKEIKEMLTAGDEMWDDEDGITESLIPNPTKGNVWRTDAAALLALMASEQTRASVSIDWIKDCLDKNGYLLEDGHIDYEAARTQVESLYVEKVWDKVEEMGKEGF